MRLAGILDQRQAVAVGDRPQRRHVGRPAVQVDRQDAGGPGGDGRLDLLGIDVVGGRIHVDEHRGGAGMVDGVDGGDEGVGHRDDLVTGPDPHRPQDQLQGREARVDPDTVADPAVGGELLLEGHDRLTEHEVPAVEDLGDGRQ